MKTKIKKMKNRICSAMAFCLTLSALCVVPATDISAKESIGNGLVLSTDTITVTTDTAATFTAALGEGSDASRLACIMTDSTVASITPVAYASNVAAFQVNYGSGGSTTAAIYNVDNPAVVAYMTITATPLIMDIPARLGTNHNNYCKVVSYEFVPYDFTYANFNDYKSTLNIQYQCAAYKDDEYNRWGCYGYFYDAAGNVLSKVHLYASSLAKDRIYHSEFNVPVNAVRFSIEGF
ncbi:MAG: hypothetical protein K2N73_00285 [Lachnospiraceae bacterium]|nr:hypothetical protein [Lachnospiraceae bacterium]